MLLGLEIGFRILLPLEGLWVHSGFSKGYRFIKAWQFHNRQPPPEIGFPGGWVVKAWHPTPVLLPGKSHGRRSLVGCSPWGRWGSDTTERQDSLFTFMHWRRKWQPLQYSFLEHPRDGGAWWAAIYGVTQSLTQLKWLSSSRVVKKLPTSAADLGSVSGSRRSPGGGHGNPLQYPCLGNPMDRGAWRAAVRGAAKSRTRLSN